MSEQANDFLRSMGIPLLRDSEDKGDETASATQASSEEPSDDFPPGGGDDGNPTASRDEDLNALQREAEELQRQFTVPDDALSGHVGSAGDGAVRVTVGADGRVRNVEIRPSWQESVREDDFDSTVLTAVANAGVERLASWGQSVADPERETDRSVSGGRPKHSEGEPESGDLAGGRRSPQEPLHDGRAARRNMEEMLSLLEGIENELDSLQERANEAAQQSVQGRSPSHLVTASVTAAGQVTGVSTHRRLFRQADSNRLAREVLSAFQAAYERAGTMTMDSLLGDGKLARIQEIVTNPEALRARRDAGDRQGEA